MLALAATLAALALAAPAPAPAPARAPAPAPTPEEPILALGGLDPVALCQGREVAGSEQLTAQQHVYRYRFSSPETLAEFQRDPARYEIQLGGGCGRMGPLSGLGDPDRHALHDGRVYIFASDSCRSGFLKDPAAHLDARDPVPQFDMPSGRRGIQLLELALAAAGGAERVDALRSYERVYEQTTEYREREVRSGRALTVVFPDRVRSESSWDDQTHAWVSNAEGGFRATPDFVHPLHPSQRFLLRRELGRDLLWILRSRNRLDFQVTATGAAHVDGTPVEGIAVYFDGTTTRLGVDPDSGRVLSAAFRGRPGAGPNGRVSVAYADFRDVDGLTLPFAQSVTFEGKPLETQSITWSAVHVDREIDPARFERPDRSQ